MPALEARQVEHGDIRVPRREFGGPHFLNAVRRIILRPDIPDIEWSFDAPLAEIRCKPALEPTRIFGNGSDRENGISIGLESLQHIMIQPWIRMVGSPEH